MVFIRGFYSICPVCGASLDPGEVCDCTRETGGNVESPQSHNDATAQHNHEGCTNNSIAWYSPEHKKGVYTMFTEKDLELLRITEGLTQSDLQTALDYMEGGARYVG